MLRTFAAVCLSALLCVPAVADDKQPAPLAPGRPAGVQQARFQMNYPVIFVGAALAAVIGGVYLAGKGQAATSTSP